MAVRKIRHCRRPRQRALRHRRARFPANKNRETRPVDNGDSADNPAAPPVRRLPLRYIHVISSPDEPVTTSRETKDDEAHAGDGQPRCSNHCGGTRSGVEWALREAVANATVDRCCHEGRTQVLRWCATCSPQGMRRRGPERASPLGVTNRRDRQRQGRCWLVALGQRGHPEGLELNRKRWERSQRFSAFLRHRQPPALLRSRLAWHSAHQAKPLTRI